MTVRPEIINTSLVIEQAPDRAELARSVERVVRRLDEIGIKEAWLAARYPSPAAFESANEALVDACRAHGARLQAQLTYVPYIAAREFGRTLRSMPAQVSPMLRLLPGFSGHRYPLVEWLLAPLPEVCDREGMTLLLDYRGQQDELAWDDLVTFARHYAGVPMVVACNETNEGILRAAFEATANLLLQVSATSNALTRLIQSAGRHRFVFGDRCAQPSSGSANATWADMSEHDRQAVLAGNAADLATRHWQQRFL